MKNGPKGGFTPVRQALLLALATVVYHAWNLGGDYVYDDFIYIVMNPAVQGGLADWTRFFTDYRTYSWLPTSHYRPLVALSFAGNVAMGWGIVGFKLTQLILHLLTVLGLFLAVRLMRHHLGGERGWLPSGAPFAVALVFAIMPFNVEAVHYLTARSAVMCGLFSVLSLVLYLEMRRQNRPATVVMLYLAHLVAMGVALLSKETTLTLPGVVFLLDLLVVGGGIAASRRQRTVRFWWPYLLYLLGLSVVLVVMPNASDVLQHFSRVFGEEWRLSAAIFCLAENIRLMLLPIGLTIAHPINEAGRLSDLLTLGSGAVVVALLAVAGAAWRRLPLLTVGLLWYFLSIAPSTFVHLNTVLLENRGYSASMGIALAFGVLLCMVWRRAVDYRRGVGVALALMAVFWLVVAVQRQQVWASNLAIWEDAVAHNPSSDDAVQNLGSRYVIAGRLDEAEVLFTTLVSRNPDMASGRQNLGRVYFLQGRYQAAVNLFEPLVKARPKDPDGLMLLAETYAAMGRGEHAIDLYRRAIDAEIDNLAWGRHMFIHEVVPGDLPEKLLDLALGMGRVEDARWAVERFEASFADHPRGHLLRLKLYAAEGHWEQALAELSALEQSMPGDPRLAVWRRQLAAMNGASSSAQGAK